MGEIFVESTPARLRKTANCERIAPPQVDLVRVIFLESVDWSACAPWQRDDSSSILRFQRLPGSARNARQLHAEAWSALIFARQCAGPVGRFLRMREK